ncbi:hypothetical protein JOF56_003513 [Kibdelosporangium banguiense]|uniref:Cyclase n=2 Tax=Kibdelosporangium banguiense TaxID=1365924 RepID=A0ABS4TFE6_9PSEU|nr:hypothetical protein [Kibdelosporangium banguiense]
MDPDNVENVAGAFRASDSTELPHMIGVTRRTLLRFHGLYFHLVEAEDDISERLYRARSHSRYQELNTELARYIRPYDPGWKEPKDAMAQPFYSWTADNAAHARSCSSCDCR